MLRISIRAKVKCRKHPKFDPAHGEASIKGGCPACRELLDLWILARAAAKSLVDRTEQLERGYGSGLETEWLD